MAPHTQAIGFVNMQLSSLRSTFSSLTDLTHAQVFGFINVQLFNQLLLRRECCSFNNGEYVKTGLAELEQWIFKAGEQWVGQSLEELRYIRQV